MVVKAGYPTPEHEAAAVSVTEFFRGRPEISAVLLACSCARGQASSDSCLDMVALLSPEAGSVARSALERDWAGFEREDAAVAALAQVGAYTHVDLDFHDGSFSPAPRGWTSGPDNFELEIGNVAAYSHPLLEQDDHYQRLREQWLPYYGDELRRERLAAVRRFCLNNLDHIPQYVSRGLYFQAFHRLYDAFREFLQGFFIAQRTYPIAYDKWIKTQVADMLGRPEVYEQLPRLFEIGRFEGDEIAEKAEALRQLVAEHVVD